MKFVFSPEQLKEAREWLMDCTWQDVDPDDIETMPDLTIIAATNRHFCGGIQGFLLTFTR